MIITLFNPRPISSIPPSRFTLGALPADWLCHRQTSQHSQMPHPSTMRMLPFQTQQEVAKDFLVQLEVPFQLLEGLGVKLRL